MQEMQESDSHKKQQAKQQINQSSEQKEKTKSSENQQQQISQKFTRNNKVRISIPTDYFKKHRDFKTNLSVVHEYAYYDEVNIIHKDDMEDGHFMFSDYLEDGRKSLFFGIFDGHNGKEVLQLILKNFHHEFLIQYKELNGDCLKAFTKTFEIIDKIIKEQVQRQDVGATAFVGVIREEENEKKMFYYANIGDTVGYMFHDDANQFEGIGQIHRLQNVEEKQRIKDCGGTTLYNRVGGILEVTRCFGDLNLTDQGVIAVPFVNKMEIVGDDRLMILGSDGLIDFVSPDEMKKIIQNSDNTEEIADGCLSKSIQRKSNDNISIMVIKFHPQKI